MVLIAFLRSGLGSGEGDYSSRFELLELYSEGLKRVLVAKVLHFPANLDSSCVHRRRHVLAGILVNKGSVEATGRGGDVDALDELEGAMSLDRRFLKP